MKQIEFSAVEAYYKKNSDCEFISALYLSMAESLKSKVETYIRRNDYVELRELLRKTRFSKTELTKLLINCAQYGSHRGFQVLIEAGANPTGFEANNEPFFTALTSRRGEILSWYYHTLGIYKIIADFIYDYNNATDYVYRTSVVVQPTDQYMIQESAYGYYDLMCCPVDFQGNTQAFFKSNVPDIYETDPAVSVLYKLVCLKY